jgi:tRNA(fMet)-specific endonuclease VapC
VIIFDTDVLSFVLRKNPPNELVRRIAGVDPADQATTSITLGELVYGAYRSKRPGHFMKQLKELLLPNLRVLAFDSRAAEVYGEVRASLEKVGRPVSEPDLRIASICLSHNASLATGNLRHFRKVPGLDAQDWLEAIRQRK